MPYRAAWVCVAVLATAFLASAPASASFHLWTLTEIYSNADGSIQFIEFFNNSNGENQTNGQQVRSRKPSPDNTGTQLFTFPSNLSSSATANRNLLLATPGFAALTGIAPNFEIPAGFLYNATGGRLAFLGTNEAAGGNWVFPALPSDGTTSLLRNGTTATNLAQSFTRSAGSVPSPSSFPVDLGDPIPTPIAQSSIIVGLQTVATGLTAPNYLTHAGDGTDRQFVVDQTGQVRLIKDGALQSQAFLDLGPSGQNRLVALNSGFDERGLLGLAFHPDFDDETKPGHNKVYTFSSEPVDGSAQFKLPVGVTPDHQNVITEWEVSAGDEDEIDPGSRRVVLSVEHPQFNHNSGMITFGPDGMLYIGIGDGGNANDTGSGHNATIGNSQDRATPLGKILRIDPLGTNNGSYGVPADNPFVGVAGRADEIFATGVRNPFRFSFDGNDLIIADVGQNYIEEINRIDVTVDNDGVNFGWRVKEGTFIFDPTTGDLTADNPGSPSLLRNDTVIDPVAQYDHDEGLSAIGGFVYHGTRLPELVGKYVFGDFSDGFSLPAGRLFVADLDTGLIEELQIGVADLPLGLYVKGFGQDADGELYLLAGTNLGPAGSEGLVLRIIPEPGTLAVLGVVGLLALSRKRLSYSAWI